MSSFLFRKLIPILLSACIWTANALATDAGEVSGTIMEPAGQPAASARVVLKRSDGTTQETRTAENGTFQFFPVVMGDYTVEIEKEGTLPYHYSLHVSSGGNSAADIQLAPLTPAEAPAGEPSTDISTEGKEMVLKVRAKKRLIHTTASVSSSELSQEEIKKMPLGSEVSLPKLISSTTPGVVQGAFGQLFFRGNHSNIQYQIDGVQLPDSPSSTFGQAFSPRNIDRMEVITGGIPAEYGQRLAAVVNVVTKSGAETPSGEVELNYGSYNYFSPHAIYGGTNEKGNLRYYLSLNYNQTDRGLDTPQPESVSNQFQGGTESIHNRAFGNTEFGRVDWQVDNQNKVIFTTFHSQQNFQIPNYPSTFSINDPYFSFGYVDQFLNSEDHNPLYVYTPSDTNNNQAETNFYTQVAWKHTFSNRSYFQISPYYKLSKILYTNDPANDLASVGVIRKANPTSFTMDRNINNLGIKGDYSLRPDDINLFKAGFQLQASRSEGCIGIQTKLSRPVISNCDPTNGYFESFYVQDDLKLAKPLTLNLGMRFDATQFLFSGLTATDYLFQPRVGVNYMVSESTKLHAFYGKLFQPAPVENLRSTYSALDPTVIQPYDIKAEKDDYFEVGIAHQVTEKQVAAVNLYYKLGTNVHDDAQLLRTSIAQPFNFATGYAYGAEFSLKGEITENWSEFLNYSYQMAQGKGISGGIWAVEADHLSVDYQVLDHLQEHTANGGVTYTKNNFWWTTMAQFGSGLMDNRYPITVANSYNGSHYAAGRTFVLHYVKNL
ncbi:MAG: TonB-dependent receptor [Bdellovibrio sp.]|nr:TonB-dependent receptor [Bdellovibrio sp.]